MIFLNLAFKSLKNRAFATSLTVLSISLSVMLLLGVEVAQRAAREGFTQTISKTDLIVGARSGSLQLLLYSVFNMGSPTHNVSYETYEKIKNHPAIAWTIPYSLGDGHRGFRVVGTNGDFFKYYSFRGDEKVAFAVGREFNNLWEVVIGSEVAQKLDYKLGDQIVVAHGVTKGEGVQHHDHKPFKISGILQATGTPLDRSIYVSLEGVEALHVDWKNGAAPTHGHEMSAEEISKEHLHVHAITAFFVGAKSRIESLKIQREINEFADEPLMAIIPAVTLNELWEGLSYAEGVLRLISVLVVVISFIAMLIALMTTLNERRREMAILRAVGANTQQIGGLLVFESALLSFLGIVLGVALSLFLMLLLEPWLQSKFGLYLKDGQFSQREFAYIGGVFVVGTLIGLIPALSAQKRALKDGLSVRV